MATVDEEVKAQSGSLGGQATFKRYGSQHFRDLANKRKTFGGGRPPNPETTDRTKKKKAKKRAR